MCNRAVGLALLGGIMLMAWGCGQDPVYFPAEPIGRHIADGQTDWDVNGDGEADFTLYRNPAGRVDRIGYPAGANRLAEVIALDEIPLSECRHVVIILDGFAYDAVSAYRRFGGLGVFHEPSRVICPYPAMTDLALAELGGTPPPKGMEARYYSQAEGKVVGGAWAYMTKKNAPYETFLDYRASMIWDAIGYLYPSAVFGKEVNDAKKYLDTSGKKQVIMYFVSSAGISTQEGAEGQKDALKRLQRLMHQLLMETRGRVKFTLLSDHGHSYTPPQRIDFERHLKSRGWHLTDKPTGPRDAAYVRFGLVTYASFGRPSPAELAADVAEARGVELASYADGDEVVVLDGRGGRARIARRDGRFSYRVESGDPLDLAALLGGLASQGGYYDADLLLAATAEHVYPAPLQRLWRAHFEVVKHPPDVLASLADRFYAGSKGFSGSVNIVSTHGSLNHRNSSAFVASSIGPLPPLMRTADVKDALGQLTGRPFPAGPIPTADSAGRQAATQPTPEPANPTDPPAVRELERMD